jgi:hypothetical protein
MNLDLSVGRIERRLAPLIPSSFAGKSFIGSLLVASSATSATLERRRTPYGMR